MITELKTAVENGKGLRLALGEIWSWCRTLFLIAVAVWWLIWPRIIAFAEPYIDERVRVVVENRLSKLENQQDQMIEDQNVMQVTIENIKKMQQQQKDRDTDLLRVLKDIDKRLGGQ